MDNLDKTRRRIKLSMFGLLAVENILIIATFFILSRISHLHVLENILISFLASMLLAAIVTIGFADYVIGPLKAIWQLILHLSPTDHGISAPVTTQLQLGRELVAALSNQVYQMVSVADKTNEENQRTAQDLHNNFIARTLPLPLIVIDADQNIRFTNEAAAIYIGIASEDLIGKNVYMVMDMSFPSEDTFDSWLKSIKESSTTGNKTWERVRMDVRDTHPLRLFDLAAYYNHSNPQNNETVMVMFDHTEMYSQDEQAISFIALGVHELRTPLTLLRGYIEVFEDELGESLTVEQKSFMLKMHSQAEQLTIFVDNMLNVARIDDDQMELNLKSEDWSKVLKSSLETMSLRAKVRGIALHCRIATDLPPVAVDRLSIAEVISNLIDNAIKYTGDGKVININTYLNENGLIETTVQDFGHGIASNVLPNLFIKFYRDHHNRSLIGGTGLGLYLSKAIVTAHKGNIWVSSKEGEGSTFGFTLLPFDQLKKDKDSDSDDSISSSAHGWIKNHSIYKR